jgi:hypothetical protein
MAEIVRDLRPRAEGRMQPPGQHPGPPAEPPVEPPVELQPRSHQGDEHDHWWSCA